MDECLLCISENAVGNFFQSKPIDSKCWLRLKEKGYCKTRTFKNLPDGITHNLVTETVPQNYVIADMPDFTESLDG